MNNKEIREGIKEAESIIELLDSVITCKKINNFTPKRKYTFKRAEVELNTITEKLKDINQILQTN